MGGVRGLKLRPPPPTTHPVRLRHGHPRCREELNEEVSSVY